MRAGARRRLILLAIAALTGACSSSSGGEAGNEELKPAIAKAAGKAVSMLQEQASALGHTTLEQPVRGSLRPFLESMTAAAEMVVEAAADLSDAEANTFIYVGMDLAILLASGGPGTAAPSAVPGRSQALNELLDAADREKVRDLDERELGEEIRRLLRPLANITLLSDPVLVKQLVPPGSPTAARFAHWVQYDEQENPTIAIPPRSRAEESGNDPTSWNSFIEALGTERDTEGSILGDTIEEINVTAERFELRRRE